MVASIHVKEFVQVEERMAEIDNGRSIGGVEAGRRRGGQRRRVLRSQPGLHDGDLILQECTSRSALRGVGRPAQGQRYARSTTETGSTPASRNTRPAKARACSRVRVPFEQHQRLRGGRGHVTASTGLRASGASKVLKNG